MNCGNCLMGSAKIVRLVDGVCPACGTDYRDYPVVVPPGRLPLVAAAHPVGEPEPGEVDPEEPTPLADPEPDTGDPVALRQRMADPAYTPTVAEALRDPVGFMAGMSEVK